MSDECKYSDREPIHVGTVAADELHVRLLELEEKQSVSTQPIQFRDDENSSDLATEVQRIREFGTVVDLPTLHLGELTYDFHPVTRDVPTNGVSLGLKTQTRFTLTSGGDSVVGDDFLAHTHALDLKPDHRQWRFYRT